jgi:hypothetical protein
VRPFVASGLKRINQCMYDVSTPGPSGAMTKSACARHPSVLQSPRSRYCSALPLWESFLSVRGYSLAPLELSGWSGRYGSQRAHSR